MSIYKQYHTACTIADALNALASADGPARVVGGGTDLLLDLRHGVLAPQHTLVDINNIPELQIIEQRGDFVFIGAGVVHNRIISSELVQANAQALIEACSLIAGPQVRNTATIGGNVGHALPAADATIALMALNASAEIADADGLHQRSLIDLFSGPGKSALNHTSEIISGFYVPLKKKGQASSFRRVMRPQGVAIAILNCGLWLDRTGNKIVDVRLSIGPSGPTPRRMLQAEKVLKGNEFSYEFLEKAKQAVLDEASFRTSKNRATKEYRQLMSGVLLEETFTAAWERAQ